MFIIRGGEAEVRSSVKQALAKMSKSVAGCLAGIGNEPKPQVRGINDGYCRQSTWNTLVSSRSLPQEIVFGADS